MRHFKIKSSNIFWGGVTAGGGTHSPHTTPSAPQLKSCLRHWAQSRSERWGDHFLPSNFPSPIRLPFPSFLFLPSFSSLLPFLSSSYPLSLPLLFPSFLLASPFPLKQLGAWGARLPNGFSLATFWPQKKAFVCLIYRRPIRSGKC